MFFAAFLVSCYRPRDHAKAPIRSLDLHEHWMHQLDCPIIRLDSAGPVDELCDEVLVRVVAC